jgi:hypothetical protein
MTMAVRERSALELEENLLRSHFFCQLVMIPLVARYIDEIPLLKGDCFYEDWRGVHNV